MCKTIACAIALSLCLGAWALAGTLPAAKIRLGDEVFLREAWHDLHGRCVGIITNQSGVTSALEPIVDAIRRNPAICIKAIYSPEHGLRGDRPAGAYVGSYTDPKTNLPVYSLYGATRHPSAQMLAGVDVLLFDIQDVGNRAYTYISTMAYAMQAAKEFHKEIWILDRPNPIGGQLVEGPVLDPKFSSFIGLYPIAMRHGMTVGELARLFNDRFSVRANLRVIAMRDYRRTMLWPDTGLQWVQTSPNIPEWDTAVVYPATGLIDSAGINNGTGFTKPFKLAGSVSIDGEKLAEILNARSLSGVFFRAAYWTPFSGAWKEKQLSGVELVVYDPRIYRSVHSAVEILTAVRTMSPQLLSYRAHDLDIDWGTDTLRTALQDGRSAQAIESQWDLGVAAFMKLRAKYLLYP